MKTPEGRARMKAASPTGSLPVLITDAGPIWDSLAIIELAADLAPEADLWPRDPLVRAIARSMAAEMHDSFRNFTWEIPMDLRRAPTPKDIAPETREGVERDIARIQMLWLDALSREDRTDGPYLFGRFTLADAYYAPVVERFHSFAIPVADPIAEYMQVMRAHPLIEEWRNEALKEPWVHDH